MRANRDATFEGKPIPTRYVVEMFCDRVAASKVYQGSAYADDLSLIHIQMCIRDSAITEVLDEGWRTGDIADETTPSDKIVGTTKMGDLVVAHL